MEQTTRTVSVAELKAQLSEYLRRVHRGDEITVTARGVPVAKLMPIGRASGFEALVRDGIARPPLKRLPADFWKRTRVADAAGRLVEIALEERAEDR